MTDIPYEHLTNREVVGRSEGDVLTGGLGLGMILTRIVPKKDVRSITVVEKYEDVISLVAPHLEAYFDKQRRQWVGKSEWVSKVIIVAADIFDYSTSQQFDTLWTDIVFPKEDQLGAWRQLNERLLKFLRRGAGSGYGRG
jgi:spermidine synthase